MRWLLLIASLTGVPPSTAVVQPGESLAQVAKRTLGDEAASEELRALNRLGADPVTPGTELRLPGPDRALAAAAVSAARKAVEHAPAGDRRADAAAHLGEAQGLLRGANYAAAARAADRAWRLVSEQAEKPTKFAVNVDERGTRVASHAGTPVLVESQGLARRVYPGHRVRVETGVPPPEPRPQLAPPLQLTPAEGTRLRGAHVAFSWRAVAGADHYELELSAPSDPSFRPVTVKAPTLSARLAELAAGRYVWRVRAMTTDGERSEPSAPRSFELVDEPLRLEVGETQWK